MKVAAVVVTYNRKGLLGECLEALLAQTRPLAKIVLVDNASSDGTSDFLSQRGYLDNPLVDYVRLSRNIGSSGGFHAGVKRGFDAGYDWLWMMDDDAEPRKNALERLLADPLLVDAGVGGGAVVNPDGTPQKRVQDGIRNRDFLFKGIRHGEIFSANSDKRVYCFPLLGLLVSRDKIEKYGNINPAFFIQSDDIEWTLRISKEKGIIIVPEAELVHKDEVRLHTIHMGLFRVRHLALKDLWKDYYGFRNLLIVMRINQKPFLMFGMKRLLKVLLKRLFLPGRAYAFRLYIRAYVDGVFQNMEIRYLPGQKG